jgi:hypothetical protein
MGWIGLAKDRERRRALVKTVLKSRVHKMLGSSGVATQMAAPRDGLSSVQLVQLVSYFVKCSSY